MVGDKLCLCFKPLPISLECEVMKKAVSRIKSGHPFSVCSGQEKAAHDMLAAKLASI
jgi:hypothetical protein